MVTKGAIGTLTVNINVKEMKINSMEYISVIGY
jgi:hypothetical protein